MILGRGGDDVLVGGDGDDILRGGSGDDTLVGARGADRMFGGHDDDVMVWNNGDGSDLMHGGSGHDRAVVNGAVSDGDEFTIEFDGDHVDFERVNLAPFENEIFKIVVLEVNGGGGDDRITGAAGLAGAILLDLDGGAGDDLIVGGDGNDRLAGGSGDDVLVGFRGSDVMRGGHGDDVMVWNNGDGSDVMNGGVGEDHVVANGSDTDADVFLVAADGANVDLDRLNLVPFQLDGGRGDDALTGRSGADTFVFRFGDDVIRDFHFGEDEIDLSAVPGVHRFADLEPLISEAHGDTVIDLGSGSLTLKDVAASDLGGHDFIS